MSIDSLRLPKICAISFDLDDTLWPVAPVITAAEETLNTWLAEYHPRVLTDLDSSEIIAIRERVKDAHPHLDHDLTQLRQLAITECLTLSGYHPAKAEGAAKDAMTVFLTARNRVSPFNDVEHSLQRLSQRYALIGLSNGNADLKQTPLAPYFESGLTAGELGKKKPHHSTFLAASNALQCAHHELLHVGDHPVEDVIGALDSGCHAIWMNRDDNPWRAQHSPTAIVNNLHELADALCPPAAR